MALFADGAVSTIDDLLGYESSILDVARIEGIDLARKLELAEQELSIELTAFLVENSGSTPALENVVVTESLKKWHTFQTLKLVYRDAYNRQNNERYLAKTKTCEQLASWALKMLFQIGVGIVDIPVARAERPNLSVLKGPHAAGIYYVQVTWLDQWGAEGAPSELAVITTPDGSAISVTAVNPPVIAQRWNVYAGYSYNDITLQNDSPIELGVAWVESSTGLRNGRKPGTGQVPEYYIQSGGIRRDLITADTSLRLLRG